MKQKKDKNKEKMSTIKFKYFKKLGYVTVPSIIIEKDGKVYWKANPGNCMRMDNDFVSNCVRLNKTIPNFSYEEAPPCEVALMAGFDDLLRDVKSTIFYL